MLEPPAAYDSVVMSNGLPVNGSTTPPVALTLSLAQDFANPNEKETFVLRQAEMKTSHIYGLRLVLLLRIGRSIRADERMRWPANTETSLLKQYGRTCIEVRCNDVFFSREMMIEDALELIHLVRVLY